MFYTKFYVHVAFTFSAKKFVTTTHGKAKTQQEVRLVVECNDSMVNEYFINNQINPFIHTPVSEIYFFQSLLPDLMHSLA